MSALLPKLESMLARWESEKTLREPSSFSSRMEALDSIDLFFSESDLTDSNPGRDLANRARVFAAKLNSVNDQLFNSIRREIHAGICPYEFRQLLEHAASGPPRGLAYDYLDDLIAGVFQFQPPTEEPRPLSPDSVFYQPTPARHIFHLISAAAVTEADTLIDLGSGLGHVPLLTSICTGATSIGIELDPAWVATAAHCAVALNLDTVTFSPQDVLETDFSAGTVFYLYTPFTGATLYAVLEALRVHSARRPIRICTLGPCVREVSRQSWLRTATSAEADQITVFLPRQ